MTNTREELIREARQAVLTMDYERAYQGGLVGRLADALESDAVFEQSLTPTNDEREASIEEVAAAFQQHEGAPTWKDNPVARDAALRWHMRGFKDGLNARRPVQGEPTDAWAGRARRAEAALLRVRDIHIATMEALSETFSAVAVPEQGENRV